MNVLLCVSFIFVCVVSVLSESSQPCTTPNGETAQCVSLFRCSKLAQAIVSQNESQIAFFRQSLCGTNSANKDPMVCCGSDNTFSFTPTNSGHNSKPVQNITTTGTDLFPSKRICGYQQRDDRFENRNITVLDEFPWLALLNFTNGEKTEILAVGTIIGRRYILTAANTFLSHQYRLTHVRLGEYNPHKNEDCLENPDYPECNEPAVDIAVEEIIAHPNYSRPHKTNDIALLRLKEPIRFTDFIRPICLPTADVQMAVTGDFLITSGWRPSHFSDRNKELLDRKKKAKTRLIALAECKSLLESLEVITESQMCAIDDGVESACLGDVGGPAMFANGVQWHIEGIISYGLGCGKGSVSVQTKVSAYLDWITSTVRP